MLKLLLDAMKIAAALGIHLSTILFILELLKQFDRSLIKSVSQSNRRQARKAGFVYVLRNKANGVQFKIGYRAKPPWRDGQLRAEMGETGDFVLVIPSKDASALEKKLRNAFAKNSKKREWFELDTNHLLEIKIIAALVMVAAGDTLGMSPVDDDVVQLGTKLFEHIKRLAFAVAANMQSKHRQRSEVQVTKDSTPDKNDYSTIPNIDWEWESVMHVHYRDLPKAKGKSCYVCIIRDNDAKLGKIFLDDHPVKSIDVALAERWRQFPLEIVMILKVKNKRKARRALLSPLTDQEEGDWVALSNESLGEIKKFATAEWLGDSFYVEPRTHFELETLPTENFREYPKLEDTAGYVCVVQGIKCGKRRKIWTSRHPKRWTRYSWRARELNSPQDLRASSDPIRFKCLVRAAYAQSFKKCLRNRYREQRRRKGWFELEEKHLQEINSMGT